MKAVVIYYSCGGNTKSIAEKVARELNCGGTPSCESVPQRTRSVFISKDLSKTPVQRS